MNNDHRSVLGKLLIAVAVISFMQIAISPISPALAGTGNSFAIGNPLKADSIGSLVLNFVDIFSYVVIILAVLVLIYIGFQYIMASAKGDSNRIKDLHSWLLWAVVGIAVVIGAQVIVKIVVNTISATGTIDKEVTQSFDNTLKK